MKTDKEKLLDFVNNLTDEDINFLAAHYKEIVALFEATEQPYPRDNPGLTA